MNLGPKAALLIKYSVTNFGVKKDFNAILPLGDEDTWYKICQDDTYFTNFLKNCVITDLQKKGFNPDDCGIVAIVSFVHQPALIVAVETQKFLSVVYLDELGMTKTGIFNVTVINNVDGITLINKVVEIIKTEGGEVVVSYSVT